MIRLYRLSTGEDVIGTPIDEGDPLNEGEEVVKALEAIGSQSGKTSKKAVIADSGVVAGGESWENGFHIFLYDKD